MPAPENASKGGLMGALFRRIAGAPQQATGAPTSSLEDPRSAIAFGNMIIFIGIGSFLFWASLAPLDEGVPSTGVVVVESHRKIVAHLTGGTVADVKVRENQIVREGDVLLTLDSTRAQTAYTSTLNEYIAAAAKLARLTAEQTFADRISFPEDVLAYAKESGRMDLIQAQEQVFRIRRQALTNEQAILHENLAASQSQASGARQQLAARQQQVALLNDELQRLRPLVEEGYAPRTKLFEQERQIAELTSVTSDIQARIAKEVSTSAELRLRILQRRQEFLRDVESLVADASRETANLREKLRDTAQAGVLTSAQVAALTTSQVRAFETDDVVALTTDAISAFNTADVAALTTDQLANLTTLQISVLSTSQILALTTTEIVALTTAQIQALTGEQLQAMTTTQVRAMETVDIAAIQTTDIVSMTTHQLESLSMAQVNALSTQQITALADNDPAQLAAVNSVVTPLVLDLNGNGIETIGIDAGVKFDLTASGHANSVGWVAGSDGFLALDRNHDGRINDGSELFGSATRLADGSKAKDGFQALADLDSNHDDVINSQDAQFKDLQVWTDSNQDGISQAGELHSLKDLGITQLNLGAAHTSVFQNGNWIGLESSFVTNDGMTHALADVWLQINQTAQNQVLDLSKIDPATVQPGALARIDMSGNGGHGDVLMVSAQDVQKFGQQDLVVNDQTGSGHVQMMIQGDGTDAVKLLDAQGGHWTDAGTTVVDGQTFQILNDGNAQLLIGVRVHDITT